MTGFDDDMLQNHRLSFSDPNESHPSLKLRWSSVLMGLIHMKVHESFALQRAVAVIVGVSPIDPGASMALRYLN